LRGAAPEPYRARRRPAAEPIRDDEGHEDGEDEDDDVIEIEDDVVIEIEDEDEEDDDEPASAGSSAQGKDGDDVGPASTQSGQKSSSANPRLQQTSDDSSDKVIDLTHN
jgi:hypothetical protein